MIEVQEPRVGALPDELRSNLVALLNSWRDDMPALDPEQIKPEDTQLIGVTVEGKVVGGYVLQAIPMAFEMVGLAINPDFRRRGLGRMCCMDALFRAGKRPLVLSATVTSAPFAKAVGFKIIGKRKQPDGSLLIRLGWHAPRPTSDPNNPLAC